MAHLLVSWLARTNDFFFKEGKFDKVNPTGPNPQFHESFFLENGLDEHVLLYSNAKDEPLAERLLAHLLGKFPARNIRIELLPLVSVIDLAEVKTKVETWLLQYQKHEVTIFFSPGTSIMQLAWYLCHMNLGLKTRLVQTQEGKFSPDGMPALMRLDVEQSTTPVTAIIREQQLKSGAIALILDEETHFLSDSLHTVYQRAHQVAQTDNVTVLIRGESGTGKVRWSGKNGHGESNFPLSWKQKNQPANGLEPNMMQPFGPRQSAA